MKIAQLEEEIYGKSRNEKASLQTQRNPSSRSIGIKRTDKSKEKLKNDKIEQPSAKINKKILHKRHISQPENILERTKSDPIENVIEVRKQLHIFLNKQTLHTQNTENQLTIDKIKTQEKNNSFLNQKQIPERESNLVKNRNFNNQNYMKLNDNAKKFLTEKIQFLHQ
jgi:hypothetical protein